MIETARMSTSLILIPLLAIGLGSCRDPEYEEFPWQVEGFDPANPAAGPAPLCPYGSDAPFNNSLSPHLGGEAYPDLVLEVFSYFRCQNCATLAEMMHHLWSTRVDFQQRVRVFFHHFPLYEHKTAMELHASAIAAQEQGNDYFWLMHDYIYAGLNQTPAQLLTPEDLYVYARDTLGLDMVRYEQVMNDPETMQQILWDKEQAAQYGLIGTPGIYLCGEKISGWKQNLEPAIDALLNQ